MESDGGITPEEEHPITSKCPKRKLKSSRKTSAGRSKRAKKLSRRKRRSSSTSDSSGTSKCLRKKRKLPAAISPVPEEHESANSSRIQPPSVAPETSHRPFSLSPPLMMEVEPNHHNETNDDDDAENVTDITKSSSDVLPKSSSNEDGDTDSLSSSVLVGSDAEEVNADTCDTETSEHSMDYRLVTFQADVHKAPDDMVPPPSVLCEQVTEGNEADTHIGGDNQNVLLENRYVPDNIDIIPELDVMKTPQIEHKEHSRTRKRSSSYSSSSSSSSKSKRPRYEEAGTQTSVDRDNRSNFPYVFVGRTLTYKICTCADHVCASTSR